MSEIKLGIKIEADVSKGQAGLATAETSLRKTGQAAQQVTQNISGLHAGFAKLNEQFARQTAAKAWSDQLAQASAGAQRLKQQLETTTSAWAKLSQQGMQRLDATAWANKLTQATHQATQAITAQTQAAQNQEKSLLSWLAFWGKVHMVMMVGQQAMNVAKGLAQTADTYTNLNSRLKLVSGSTQELARAQQASFEIAQRYNMALDDTGRLYTRLAPIAQNLNRSQSELITLMSGVGAAMKVSGATAAEASSTITQLTQSLAAANVQGADFNLLYDTAPAIVRAVEKELSGLVQQYGSLKNAMEKGAVSNQQLFDVLVKTSAEFQRQAATMNPTVSGALQNLNNAWTQYIGQADQANSSSRRLAESLDWLAKNLGLVMDSVTWPLEALDGWKQMAAYAREIDRLYRSISGNKPPANPADAQAVNDMLGVNGAIDQAEWERRKAANKEYFQSMADGAKLASGSLEKLGKMQTIIYATAIKHKLDPALMLGLAQAESGFDPGIQSKIKKPKGDNRIGLGLYQFIPTTGAAYGLKSDADRMDPVKATDAAARLLKDLMAKFPGDLKAVIAAWNAGPGAVQKAQARGVDLNRIVEGSHIVNVLKFTEQAKAKLGDLKLEAGDVLDPKELAKATDDYYKFVETTLDQRARLEDAQSQTRLAKQKIELEALQQQAEQAAKASERTIADVLQQQGLDAGLKAISEAQAQQERFLREAQAKAGGTDTEAVRAAQRKISDIDALIAKTKELDQWDQRGAELQNQRAIAEQALAQARIEAGGRDLGLQQALQKNQAEYDALRQSAIREQMQREMEAATTVDQRNAAIQRAITLEQQLGLASTDSAKAAAELKQKEAAFIANINAELAYQTQLYAALKAAKEQGATPEQLGGMASVSDQMREAGQSVSAQELAKLRPYLEALEQIKQKKQEILGVDQQVREEQLRLNQAWQEAVQQAEEFATQASNAFGSLGTAIGKVVVGMAQYGQRAMQIQRDAKQAMDDLKKSGKSTPEKEFRVMEAAADKSLSNQMGLWGDLTAAAAGFFKEGSDGYKAMTVASQMFYAIKMGLAVKDAVLQISSAIEAMMMDQTRTTVEVANAGTRAAAKGAEAIMNQGQGDPYSAIPRMIAMAAMVTTILAGFGIAISGAVSGGGGASVAVPDTEAMQKKTGTGSVFGDAEAQSSSLRNSLAILEDNSSADLDYTREMRDLLTNIDEGINGLANKIYATVRPPQLTEAMIKKGIDVVDYGIQGIQQTVGSILKGGLQGQSYQSYKREVEKSSFNFMMPGMDTGGGEKVVKWVRTIFNDIDAGVAKQFGMVLGDVVQSLELAAKGLGIAGPDMVDKINRFVVDIGQISLKDMNAQEMSDAIQSVISKISDDLARLTMPQLKGFRQAGEGFAETTLRVYEASMRASGSLKPLGIELLDLADVQDKTAKDLAAAFTRESIARAENGSSIGEYIRTLQGSTDEVIEQYQALRQARNLFAASGRPDATIGGDMINGAGGLSKFQSGMEAYRDNFLTETERMTAGWMDMADSFSAFGLKMPTTNAEFRKLVNGIDTSTQAGRELKGAVLALAPAFSELQSVMDDAMSTLKAAYDTAKQQSKDLRDYLNSLKTGQDTGGSVQQRYLSAKALYEETLRKAQAGDPAAIAALQNVSSTFLDLSRQYFGATAQYAADLNNVQVSVGSLADVIDAQIAQAETQVPALVDNTTALTGLKDALIAFEITLAKVNSIQSSQKGKGIDDINAGNKSDEEAANRRAAREKEASDYERRLAEMVRDLRYARNNGQDKKADKIKAEIDAYIVSINTDPDGYSVVWDGKRHDVQLLAKGGPAQPGWAIVGERGPELVQFQQSAFVHTAAETARMLRERSMPDWEALVQGPIGIPVQARATGGYTPPGLTLVGERGPELVDFARPTQVYTADQTRQALGMDTSKLEARLEALERAIAAGLKVDQAGYQALRSELQAIRAELAEQTTAQKLASLA